MEHINLLMYKRCLQFRNDIPSIYVGIAERGVTVWKLMGMVISRALYL